MNKELRIERTTFTAVILLLLSIVVAFHITVKRPEITIPSVKVMQWGCDTTSWRGWDVQSIDMR